MRKYHVVYINKTAKYFNWCAKFYVFICNYLNVWYSDDIKFPSKWFCRGKNTSNWTVVLLNNLTNCSENTEYTNMTERQNAMQTERQRDWETERQRDRKKEIETQRERDGGKKK